MAKIFLLGTGPLLEAGARVMSGQCLRTWHFAAPLLEAGHQVRLMTVPIPGATRDEVDPPVEQATYQGHRYQKLLSNAEHRVLELIRAEALRADAVVGVNAWPAFLAARALEGARVPFWADLNGWTMAEGQIRAATLGHDRDYGHFWRTEVRTLLVADFFSTVSQRQADALYGELATLGLLTHDTFAEEIAGAVPNAVYPDYVKLERTTAIPSVLQGRVGPLDSVILWSGGFNSWTDVDLVTEALGRALSEEPTLHFVSTGGPVIGHDEETHRRFEERARERLPAERWHPLGWVDFEDVLALHAFATVGINVDGRNTETRFGARNRLTNMLGAGLPVVTTMGTEVAEWIERNHAGEVVPQGDATALAGALVRSARDRELWQERAVQARTAALHDFAAANTLRGFLSWAANPRRRPGRDAPPEPGDAAFHLRRWALAKSSEALPFNDGPGGEHPEGATPLGERLTRIIRKLKG